MSLKGKPKVPKAQRRVRIPVPSESTSQPPDQLIPLDTAGLVQIEMKATLPEPEPGKKIHQRRQLPAIPKGSAS